MDTGTFIAPRTDQSEVFAQALLIAIPREEQGIAQPAGVANLAVDRLF